MQPRILQCFVICILLAKLVVMPVYAGSQQTSQSSFSVEEIKTLAKGSEQYAAMHGARAFIIARTGRPVKDLPKGIKFTHTAIAIYSEIITDDGSREFGYAIHNLYQEPKNKTRSFLFVDYPIDFFWGAKALQAGIIIPSDEIQRGLIAMVSQNEHLQLHNPQYSVIANPYNNVFQNCTEFTLNMLNAAIYNTLDMQQIKTNTRAYFAAQKVNVSPLKLMLGSMFAEDVSRKDHSVRPKTATFMSISNYLERFGLIKHAVILDKHLTPNSLH
ncbi:DUF2145 domain-containing protein [Agaribacter marinus]|uniref:DUF2145 domain-containing protein n=1 Tax=Agaribacter marinus TaxID=1431249 RepID=A0AA37T0G5_9ALTE|nr:DUF2145 domain-containing protein [Agaribacter marinus]GLR72741.1 hypothetical protein GCM10007852_36490 [Agaribacter marinus]